MLARVCLQRREDLGEDLGEDLWQWTKSERRRLEPVARLSNLEGEVLSMLLVYRNMVVADCLESVCESLTNDVQGIHLERFDTLELF